MPTEARAVDFTILWDSDGILVDTEALYFRACREALSGEGVELSRESFVEISLRQGRSTLDLLREAGRSEEEVARVMEGRNRLYARLLEEGSRPRKGAPEAFHALRGRVRMGVVTSAPRRDFELAHAGAGFREHLEFAVVNEDYERSKPHPDPYLLALERHGVDRERCIVVEDTERGLAAARAAGLPCLVVPHELSRDGAFEGAEAVLGCVSEVVGHVERRIGPA